MARATEEKKNSFIIYSDTGDIVEQLSDQEAGRLFKAVFQYVRSEHKTLPDFGDNRALEFTFIPIKNYLDRDKEKYEKKCEDNKKRGQLGGRPKKASKENESPKDDPEHNEDDLPFSYE